MALDESARDRSLKPQTALMESLSQRELEILRLVAAGLSNREAAAQLAMAVSTVKWYLQEIYTKLGVRSRTQAIARARDRAALLTPPIANTQLLTAPVPSFRMVRARPRADTIRLWLWHMRQLDTCSPAHPAACVRAQRYALCHTCS